MFKSEKILLGDGKYIPSLAEAVCKKFAEEGFETISNAMESGVYELFLNQGGMAKAAVGLKKTVNVKIEPHDEGILIKVDVGSIAQQVIPTAITTLVWAPVLVPQAYGLVQQFQMDAKVFEIAEKTIKMLKVADMLDNI